MSGTAQRFNYVKSSGYGKGQGPMKSYQMNPYAREEEKEGDRLSSTQTSG